jgi:hypothetical protein
LNRPASFEGWQVWDLATRLGGQMRVMPGAVTGWDMTAVLALAGASGVPAAACAEFLPAIEAAFVAKTNETLESKNHE